jgi:hypothetical protein
MNVFEDLIVELKEENLLEETVIKPSAGGASGGGTKTADAVKSQGSAVVFQPAAKAKYKAAPNSSDIRAMLADRMAALQLIEYVISSSGRTCGALFEQFDDLSVKKTFHIFGQACSDVESEEYFEAESSMFSAIEAWESDLAKRDTEIPAWALREYAENANPPLSPQALFAMARFYRTTPFSDDTSTKFEFIVTRLFSKSADSEGRHMLCSRNEIARHLSEKYREWNIETAKPRSSDDSDAALLILSLDDIAAEVDSAAKFSEMVSPNVFDRLFELKRSHGEMIFVPEIAATAVETNLRMSAKVHSLLKDENERDGSGALRARYSEVDTTLVSDAIGRTFEITSREEEADTFDDLSLGAAREQRRVKVGSEVSAQRPMRKRRSGSGRGSSLFGVNRWLLLGTFLSVIASIGIYIWSEYYATDTPSSAAVTAVEIAKPELKQYLSKAKLSGSMLYAVATPSFEQLKTDEKRDFLKRLMDEGTTNGYDRVSLMDAHGRNAGFASKNRLEINSDSK